MRKLLTNIIKKQGLASVLLAAALFCGCSSPKNEAITANSEITASETISESFCSCISCLQNKYLYNTRPFNWQSFIRLVPDNEVYYDTDAGALDGNFYLCLYNKNDEPVGEPAPLMSGNPSQRFLLNADKIPEMIKLHHGLGYEILEFKIDGFSTFYCISEDKGANIFFDNNRSYFFCENDNFAMEESTEKSMVLIGEKTRITFDIEELTAQ